MEPLLVRVIDFSHSLFLFFLSQSCILPFFFPCQLWQPTVLRISVKPDIGNISSAIECNGCLYIACLVGPKAVVTAVYKPGLGSPSSCIWESPDPTCQTLPVGWAGCPHSSHKAKKQEGRCVMLTILSYSGICTLSIGLFTYGNKYVYPQSGHLFQTVRKQMIGELTARKGSVMLQQYCCILLLHPMGLEFGLCVEGSTLDCRIC